MTVTLSDQLDGFFWTVGVITTVVSVAGLLGLATIGGLALAGVL